MVKKIKDWCISKTPPWMQKAKAKYPKTFWTVTIILIILPFSPVTFAVLHSISWLWAWMFAVK